MIAIHCSSKHFHYNTLIWAKLTYLAVAWKIRFHLLLVESRKNYNFCYISFFKYDTYSDNHSKVNRVEKSREIEFFFFKHSFISIQC